MVPGKGKKGSEGQNNSPFSQEPQNFGDVPDLSELTDEQSTDGPPAFGDVPDLEEGSPFDPGASSGQSSQVNSEQVESNTQKIKTVESRLSKVDANITTVQRESQELKKTVDKIDQSVVELLSLYEIVSNQVNPFVGDNEGGSEYIERFEKNEERINEIGNYATMIRNDLDALYQKFDTQGINKLHSKIDELSSKTNELFEKYDELNENLSSLKQYTEKISDRVDILENIDLSNVYEPSEKQFGDIYQDEEENVEKSSIILDSIGNDPTTVIAILNWIEYLVERVGSNNLQDALEYYVNIGWISEEVLTDILNYAKGMEHYVEKEDWALTPDDHTKSFMFIERMSGHRMDNSQVDHNIDDDLSKIKKEV
ncbi:MAG: FlaD/FlaE family flagellar protein [Methanohalobium sp.]